jgi:uncharacterized membrane protein YiaA
MPVCTECDRIATAAIGTCLMLVGFIFLLLGQYEQKGNLRGLGYAFMLTGVGLVNMVVWSHLPPLRAG